MTKITQKLDFRQQQSLVMTPQMQQAVKLLQMSNLELQDYLEEEIAQNPLLEKVEGVLRLRRMERRRFRPLFPKKIILPKVSISHGVMKGLRQHHHPLPMILIQGQ
jgi:DNA-directed RNA polymerase specialized sigma54-like protein